jgi:hypothetical protein
MYAFGASLFALTCGDRGIAQKLFFAVDWCIEYCERRKNNQGAVLSETDELEGRFPSGVYNLSTNALYYGGLKYGALLARELGYPDKVVLYEKRASDMYDVIENVFGAIMHKYETYRYYDENTTLRSWICLPLCMGITKRSEGTLNAMLSKRLWTENGLLTEEGDSTVWDRSTLYGFKGAFIGGKGDEIMDAFIGYCTKRLLGERVPYAVEAYPEGGKRHLSGESCLFCRIITDGILSISPCGLNSFSFVPKIPKGLDYIQLSNIHSFGKVFDICVENDHYKIIIDKKVYQEGKVGDKVLVKFYQ